jgi:hypothetical protein
VGDRQFEKWKGKWKKVGSGKEKRERWEGRMKVVECMTFDKNNEIKPQAKIHDKV